jgi:hypothetical protein
MDFYEVSFYEVGFIKIETCRDEFRLLDLDCKIQIASE